MKNEFYTNFLNNVGPLSLSFEEEGSFREGVKSALIFNGQEEIIKELIRLEIFADEHGPRSHQRTVKENEQIVTKFLNR